MGVLPYYAGTGTMAEIPLNNILFIFVDILVVMNLFAL